MSSTTRPAHSTTNPSPKPTYFQQQRDALLGEIAISLEHVLQNINKLNRSLEGVIAVGDEFGSVEALWSQFEGVMAKDSEEGEAEAEAEADGKEGNSGGDGGEGDGEREEGDETVRVDGKGK